MSDFENMPNRRVPHGIKFTTSVLEIPTPESEGIPELYASRGFYSRAIKYRYLHPEKCWVERGDPIIQAKFIVYGAQDEPRGLFKFIAKDPTWSTCFILKSPISGLLVHASDYYCGYYWDYPSSTGSGSRLVYGHEAIWPSILVPSDEPPPDDHYVQNFMHNLGTLAEQERFRFLYSTKSGLKRLKDVGIPEEKMAAAERMLGNYKRPRTGTSVVRRLNESDIVILGNIQSLRKQDLSLRLLLADVARAIDPNNFAGGSGSA